MKNTNFEILYVDHNREEVIVNRQKRHSYWKLKLVSLVLAFLIWLISGAINQSSQLPDHQEPEKPAQEQAG